MNKLFDEEKQELYTEIRLLKDKTKQYDKLRQTYDINMFFEKWYFYAKLIKIKNKKIPEERLKAQQQEAKTFF